MAHPGSKIQDHLISDGLNYGMAFGRVAWRCLPEPRRRVRAVARDNHTVRAGAFVEQSDELPRPVDLDEFAAVGRANWMEFPAPPLGVPTRSKAPLRHPRADRRWVVPQVIPALTCRRLHVVPMSRSATHGARPTMPPLTGGGNDCFDI